MKHGGIIAAKRIKREKKLRSKAFGNDKYHADQLPNLSSNLFLIKSPMKSRPLSQYTDLTKNEFFFLFITSAGRTCVLVFINQLLQKIGGQSYIKYLKKNRN